MEEKINQILKNQEAIMKKLLWGNNEDKLKLNIHKTFNLLNPTKQPSIAERTHDALSKDGEE